MKSKKVNMNFWNSFQQLIFEHGVALRRQDDGSWRYVSSLKNDFLEPSSVENVFRIRPILATIRLNAPDESWSGIIPAKGGRLLDVLLADLQQLVYSQKSADLFLITRSLFYLLSGVLYHCKQLARLYMKECERSIKPPYIAGVDRVEVQAYECHFEFEALITAIIRAFDMMRYLLWSTYGSRGSIPNSFARTVSRCPKLPPEFQRQLERICNTYLKDAKKYRDCIQHYVDVGSSSWSMIYELKNAVWGITVRIPDNPEEKSARKFKFHKDLDALTYGWELTTELFGTTKLILETILPKHNDVKSK